MNHHNKGKAKKILAWLSALLLLILTLYTNAGSVKRVYFHISLTSDTTLLKKKKAKNAAILKDTISQKKDSITERGIIDTVITDVADTTKKVKKDSVILVTDTIPLRISKDSLDAPVTYHADDSMILDVPGKKILLYGKGSNVKYIDNQLTAPLIEYNQSTNLVKAYLQKDSMGKVIAYPEYNQGDFKTKSDTIEFNMANQVGITKGTYTQQGEMYVYAEVIKKVDKEVFYAARARFTTCNLDTPHFAFISNKIKFVNKKMAYSGPVHPEFEGVPLPVYLPFGIYPLKQGRHSGLLAPSFSANDQMGLSLNGLGYYKILNETWDAILMGTIYSYGGWTANLNPRYYKRYRYQGNFALDVQHFKTNFKGDPDYIANNGYKVRWAHTADTKARPGVTFRASVEAGSSKFNSNVQNNVITNLTNQLTSSINYSKQWKNKPFYVSIGASHNQNSVSGLINVKLPDLGFNVSTINPFRKKDAVGKLKWYENIGIALNTTGSGLTSFYDTAGAVLKQAVNNYQWGINHNVPITLSLPPVGFFQIAPTVTYQERWYQRKMRVNYDSANRKFDTLSLTKGFYTARDMNFGLAVSTRIFGLYTFRKSSKVQAIRHEVKPFISANYKPDFTGNSYYTARIDSAGNTDRYSLYRGSVYGAFQEGKFAGLNFGIDNNLQMKIRSKKDTGEGGLKKITLLDGFSINSSYNFLVDSFRLSPFIINLRTNLFDKISITGGATLDPYLTSDAGRRINKLVWSQRAISLGTLTSAQLSLQTSFRGGDKSKGTGAGIGIPPSQQQINATGLTLDEYQQEAAYIQNNPGEFVDFSIPWSIDLTYTSSLFKTRVAGTSKLKSDFQHSVTVTASVNLTPKWKIGINSYYNIATKQLGTFTMFLSREMHCWQMSINIGSSPNNKYFTINISPKSGLLRDLKVNRTRYFREQ